MALDDRTTNHRQKAQRRAHTAEQTLERLRVEWREVKAQPPCPEREVALRAIESAARAVKILKGQGVAA